MNNDLITALNNQKNIGIYGTGLAAQTAFEALCKKNIEVSFFLDGDETKTGTFFCGRKIIDIGMVPCEMLILIAANPKYHIEERLEEKGINNWLYADPEYLHLWSEGFDRNWLKVILKENEEKIYQVYNMLADNKSQKVFRSILEHRLRHDLSLIDEIYDENQYFGNDVIGLANGNIVDCGAYTGDTLRRFIEQKNGGGHITIMLLKRNMKIMRAS